MNNPDELERRIKEETDKYQGITVALSGGVDSSLLTALIKPRFVVSVELPGDIHNEIQYSERVAKYLNVRQEIIKLDDTKFDEYFHEAVKIIGRPIPHFNIFPLYCMYKKLAEEGITELILGDGPDETMCGYARNLIMAYLYGVSEIEAFKPYTGLLHKVLLDPRLAYSTMLGKPIESVVAAFGDEVDLLKAINKVDIELMRPDMDDMSNRLAAHFGIKNIRPYQDNPELDQYMLNLPPEDKIKDVEFGKALLRKVAEKYLPKYIAWRKIKVGGPVYPVNQMKGWTDTEGDFGKKKYLALQAEILGLTKLFN